MRSHAAVAAEFLGEDLVRGVIDDLEGSALPDNEKALLRYVRKVNGDPLSVSQTDIDSLQDVGWTQEAIYDALSVTALFNFYNTWVEGAGCRTRSDAFFSAVGKALHSEGYLHPWTKAE